MTKDEAKQEIRANWRKFGREDGSRKGIVCPFCGNGSGKDGDGLREIPGSGGALHCFKCSWNGDALDLIRDSYNCDYPTALKVGADELGLTIDGDASGWTMKPKASEPKPKPEAKPEPLPDFTAEIENMLPVGAVPAAVAYLHGRGISIGLAERHNLRFNPKSWNPKGPWTEPAIIVPLDKNAGYAVRGIMPDGFKGNGKGSKALLFNGKALAGTEPVFVCEGWADALSIEAVGGAALALNGLDETHLIEALNALKKDGKDVPPLVLSLDADGPGRGETVTIRNKLQDMKLYFITGNLYSGGDGDAKDSNEALLQDRAAFASAVEKIQHYARAGLTDEQVAAIEVADKLFTDRHMDDYTNHVMAAGQRKPISTGFSLLDKVLGPAGLYPGLFVLGGTTGAGKTSFVLQVAGTIAASGRPVLYVALEMSRYELIAKSISRITGELADGGSLGAGTAYRDLLNGEINATIAKAQQKYTEKIAPNMAVMEGLGDVGAASVRRMAEAIGNLKGTPPVVIVDYLQIMAPRNPDSPGTERQNVDYNVVELKRLSRDLDMPVIVLSSINRVSSQNGGGGLHAFKESGTVESTADAALILHRMGGSFRGSASVGLGIYKNRRGPVPKDWIGLTFFEPVSRFLQGHMVKPLWQQAKEFADDCEAEEKATEQTKGAFPDRGSRW